MVCSCSNVHKLQPNQYDDITIKPITSLTLTTHFLKFVDLLKISNVKASGFLKNYITIDQLI